MHGGTILACCFEESLRSQKSGPPVRESAIIISSQYRAERSTLEYGGICHPLVSRRAIPKYRRYHGPIVRPAEFWCHDFSAARFIRSVTQLVLPEEAKLSVEELVDSPPLSATRNWWGAQSRPRQAWQIGLPSRSVADKIAASAQGFVGSLRQGFAARRRDGGSLKGR
jgi:hypothetical protein